MKKCMCFIALLFLCMSVSAAVLKGLDLSLVSKFSSVNIYEGCLFNDYFMSYYGLSLKAKTGSGHIGIEPYYTFNPVEGYYEKGVNLIVKAENKDLKLDLNPFYVSYIKDGDSNYGVAFWGQLTYKTKILDLKVAYASTRIKDRHDLNGNLYRFTLEKVLTLKKFGKVGINTNLIYNNGFFEDRPGRFIYTTGLVIKNMDFLLPVRTEFFVVYAYSTDVINKVMVGVKLDFSLI